MSDKIETEVNKIQKNLENISLQTAKTGDMYFVFSDSLLNANKKLDSLGKVVDSLTTQIEKSNTDFKKSTEVELAGWEIAVRYASKTIFEAVGAVTLAPVMTPFWGGITGGVVYDGFQSWLDSILRPDPNKKPYDSTPQGDRSMVSYYDAEEKKIRFEKVQKLKYSDDWSNPQKITSNFIGRQIGYFNNQLVNPPKQQKTVRRKKRTSSKSQNNTYQNPSNDFVLQLQAFIALIQQKFVEANFTKKLEEKTNITADALSNLSKEINTNISDYQTPGRRYSIPSDHYTAPRLRGKSALPEEKNEDDGKALSKKDLNLNTKAFEAIFNKKNIAMMKVFDETIQGVGQNIGSFFTGLAQGNPDAFKNFLKSIVTTFISSVQAMIFAAKGAAAAKGITSFGLSLITDLPALAAAWLALEAAKGIIQGLNKGGAVKGFGDTDTVPAMLTPGEYVIKKSVVNKFGSGFFEWINGGGLTNSLAGHYAGGGMVAAANSRQPMNVNFGDIKFKVRGQELVGVINNYNYVRERGRG